MDLGASKSTTWDNGESSTLNPALSPVALAEEIPSLTLATIVGVALTVLCAIGLVFTLGVLLDCRQQRILDNKVKRLKSQRRANIAAADSESAGMTENAEGPGLSAPPALVVRVEP